MSLPTENTQVLFVKRPEGVYNPDETFKIVKSPIREPDENEVLVRIIYSSIDPTMRVWMNDARGYMEPVELNQVMRSVGLGQVITSKHEGFQEGDIAFGVLGLQEYATLHGQELTKVPVPPGASLPELFTLLSHIGVTAYFGLFDVGKPKPGDTVVVSGAAGATGSLVVQLAKIHGCRVIGIAGGPEKCRRVREEFGADVALDYRSPDFEQAFIDATPDFVNVYFDNVGGKMLDLVLTRLATYARIALCGAISEYNTDKPVGIFNYFQLVLQKATMQGFIVLDYMHRFQECAEKLLGWYMEGKIRVRVDVRQGIESAPHALTLLFTGENQGKLLVQTGEAKL